MAEPSKIELVKRGYTAWNEDYLDGLLALCHPEVSYHTSGVFPGMDPVYEGEKGMRRWWRDFHDPWRQLKVIPEKVVERGDEILVLLRFEGTGRAGIETSMRFINMIEVRDNLAYRFGARRYSEEAVREQGWGRPIRLRGVARITPVCGKDSAP